MGPVCVCEKKREAPCGNNHSRRVKKRGQRKGVTKKKRVVGRVRCVRVSPTPVRLTHELKKVTE